jgi:hypothetical protein
MPLLGVAVTAPATRRSLQRRWLVVGALAVAGLALLLAAALRARSDVHAVALQHDGATAGATVVAVDAQPTGRGRSPDGSVVVRFDAAGQSRDASVYVGGAVARYQVGQQVTVVYDPADSTRVELQGITTAGRGIAIVPALVIGALLAAMAVVAGGVGSAEARWDGSKLVIEEKANPKCADGRTYARNTVNCEVGADGQAKCTGSQPGDKRSYNVQIGR